MADELQPKTGYLYVCGFNQPRLFTGGKSAHYKQGQQFEGSTFAAQGAPTGTFTALDASTDRIVWQKNFTDSCYSGSTTTGGDLAFVGRDDGRLQAYNAANGRLLWSFQTGAGANDTASVFSLDGKEVVAFYAAGSALAGSAHGDDFWLFGLDGKLGPAKAHTAASAQMHTGEKPAQGTTASSVNVGMTEFHFTLSRQVVHTGTVTFQLHTAASPTTCASTASRARTSSRVTPPLCKSRSQSLASTPTCARCPAMPQRA